VPDIVAPDVRSRMMAGIRGRNTQPEIVLRKGLHQAGFRYRLHAKGLAGKPDLVFPKYRAVIFVNGCFWHGHDCSFFKWPSTRQEFWRAKITGNVTRDESVKERLLAAGWRVLTVWECALKGPGRLAPGEVITRSAEWLQSDSQAKEIRGLK
jgi:DNA mismatch endonuclease, patch repair protein